MKRFLLSCCAIFFGLALVIISAFVTGQSQVRGQAQAENVIATGSAIPSDSAATASTTPKPIIDGDYYLPYPGILPDHGLYPFKMVRDRLRLWLAHQPEEKFHLQLLYADKRIGAAQVLVAGGKSELGLDTAVKAEGYLSQAVATANRLNQATIWQQLALASHKHHQVLTEMKQELQGEENDRIAEVTKFNQDIVDTIKQQLPRTEEEPSQASDSAELVPLEPAEFGR